MVRRRKNETKNFFFLFSFFFVFLGRCLCGQCTCHPAGDSRIHGKNCECDDRQCEDINGEVCGGNTHSQTCTNTVFFFNYESIKWNSGFFSPPSVRGKVIVEATGAVKPQTFSIWFSKRRYIVLNPKLEAQLFKYGFDIWMGLIAR